MTCKNCKAKNKLGWRIGQVVNWWVCGECGVQKPCPYKVQFIDWFHAEFNRVPDWRKHDSRMWRCWLNGSTQTLRGDYASDYIGPAPAPNVS